MSPGANAGVEDLALTLKRIKANSNGNLSPLYRDLLKWHKNVDKRYAWVILAALFLMMTATLGPYRIYGLLYAKVTTEGIYTREEASWPVSAIFTVENVIGPFVSVISYHISCRQTMAIGGLLLVLGNGLTAFSTSLVYDVLLIGVVQGIGYAFIFMRFMEIINDYFLKYRNIALGFALCGGTLSVFWWRPIFLYLLEQFPWRYSYLGLGLVCCLNLLMVPLLSGNPMPNLDFLDKEKELEGSKTIGRKLSIVSMRALGYRNSLRQQTSVLIHRQSTVHQPIQRQASILSLNPFASSVGLERKISRAIISSNDPTQMNLNFTNQAKGLSKQSSNISTISRANQQQQQYESVSLTDMTGDESEFKWSIIWDILKCPHFHLIWYNELVYYWVFSIYCLIIIDYSIDRGCTVDEAQSVLNYQSIGELIGRLVLTILVDLRFLSNKSVTILTLFIMAGLLVLVTHVTGFIWMASITVALSALASLLYILLNGLLVDYLGERQVTLGYGMASCIGGLLLSFRPQAVGYFRDVRGTYDPLMVCLAISCAVGALSWMIEPVFSRFIGVKEKQSQANGLDA